MRIIDADRLTELIENIVPQSALELGYLYQIREYIKQMPTVDTQDLISREDALNCFPLMMQGELFTVETIRHQLKELPTVEMEFEDKENDKRGLD